MARTPRTTEEDGAAGKAASDKALEGAPTAGEISGLYQSRLNEGDESTLRRRATRSRQLCELEHAVIIPDAYKAIAQEMRTPFTRDTWLRVTAALTRDEPVGHVEPRDRGNRDSEATADIAEKWTMATFRQMNRDLGDDVIYESTKALVRDQESVVKIVHRPDAWATFFRRKPGESPDAYQKRFASDKQQPGTAMPFAWRVVDRLSMLFGDGEYGDEWALEYGEYPLPYLERRYPGMERDDEGLQQSTDGGSVKRTRLISPGDMLGGKPKPEGYLTTGMGSCVKIEYWDADWWCVVIDGSMAPGFPKPNPYKGKLPYFRAKSDPVLFALSFLVPGLDALLTMKLNWAYLSAYPTPQLSRSGNNTVPNVDAAGDGAEDGDVPAFVWSPGRMMVPPAGYTFGFVAPPPVGQDLNEMVSVIRGLIDVAGVPSVFRGIGGADQAGYAINQLIAAANLTYKKLAESLQRQFELAGEFLWHLVREKIKSEVYVLNDSAKAGKTWVCLKPSGTVTATSAPVDKLGPLTVRFRPVLPTDEQARAMIAMQLVNAPKPLMSQHRAIEKYLQEEDPQQILDEIAVEQALQEEPLHSMMIQQALTEAGVNPNAQNPASQLVGPNGQPLISQTPGGGGMPMLPGATGAVPGQAAAGTPAIPGLNQPIAPSPGPAPAILPGQGGRPAGAFPGQPGGR